MTPNPSLSALSRSSPLARCLAALLGLAVALVVSIAIGAFLGAAVPFVLGLLAVAFSAWYCGVGPSIAVTMLGLAALKFWFLPPLHTLRVADPESIFGMLALSMASVVLIAMGEARRRENEVLRDAQGELEDRVKQRTSELDAANLGLRELTARLMQLQDQERRRIARELHDSVGQTLAALTMNLTTVSADIERLNQTAKTVSDSLTLAQEMNKEVRTVSYLLHPPLLDEAGLASALRWYVDGYSKRSNVQVELHIPEDFGRLPQEMETALFRTVQECLTNVHRHSGSTVASIDVDRTPEEIRLAIKDRGNGIPPEKLDGVTNGGTPGVGIGGMRERMRQLGGSLVLQSSQRGTTVEARLPMTRPSNPASSDAAA
jgi:signal transduction histidine kinase